MHAPYIDIHSHQSINAPNEGIQNFNINDIKSNEVFPLSYSIGLHPWKLSESTVDSLLTHLENLANNKEVKAIGECGIDRVVSVDINLQKDIFQYQLEMAERLDKAVIVHNVRAFSDMLEILKKVKPNIPIIFHAFSGNEEILKKLLHYNTYFSFGHDLIYDNSKASRIISRIPRNCLFLETDEWQGDIKEIYILATKLLNISIIELRSQIYYTYKSLFL
jgi:TatD DNase family protein